MNAVIQQLTSHRSIRRYTTQSIGDELLHELIRAGQHAASSNFIQAYSIIRVRDRAARERIAKTAGDQRWIVEAAEFLVMCADLRRVAHALHKTGGAPLEGHTEHFLSASIDVALMAQNVMVAAESVGLGAVFIGGIRNDPMMVSELLELPDLVYPEFGLCLGWPDQQPEVKPRMPLEMIMHEDRYHDERLADDVDRYDSMMGDYYAARSENQRQSDWSTPTASGIQGKKREHMLEFLQARGFLKR